MTDRTQRGRRIDLGTDDPGRALAGVVLAVVEVLRQLLERQAVRRVASGGLTAEETERIGLSLMRLEANIRQLVTDCRIDEADVRSLADHMVAVRDIEGVSQR